MLEVCEKWMNSKLKKMTIWDIKMIKLSVAAFTLLIAKLWSPILSLDWYWYAALGIIFAAKPAMKMLKK